jgi:hypothetical protein
MVAQASLPAREVAQVADIRYFRKMINGAAVVTAPAEIRRHHRGPAPRSSPRHGRLGHATVVLDMTAPVLALADGGGLRLVVPAGGPVPRIFALTCLDSLIPCFASLKEALAQTPAAANQRRDARARRRPTSDHS